MASDYLLEIRSTRGSDGIGRKAENLRFLMRKGYRVPRALVIPYHIKEYFDTDAKGATERLRQELSRALNGGTGYAVRSSANLEDHGKHSFAGQFKTFLHRVGTEQVLEAIRQVWLSMPKKGDSAYMQKLGEEGLELRMAVIVQEMVPQRISGVAFTRNPLNGSDEVVIEAVQGSGEALVQQGATPERWVVRGGHVVETPPSPISEMAMIGSIASEVKRMEREYGAPLDLEWVFDGREVYWVQLRDITAMGQVSVYSNTFSKELLPGLIKPLVWSVNIPLVNGAWIRFLSGMTGVKGLNPHKLAKQFYYRAYFNMGAMGMIWQRMGLPEDSLERLTGFGSQERKGFKLSITPKMLTVTPNLANFLLHNFAFADKLEEELPQREKKLEELDREELGRYSEEELLGKVDALSATLKEPAYYNVLSALASSMFNRMLESRLRKAGVDLKEVDPLKGVEQLRQYYPNEGLRSLHRAYKSLDAKTRDSIKDGGYRQVQSLPSTDGFRAAFEEFMAAFGYISESGNDFTAKPWREDPDLVLTMIIGYPEEAAERTKKGVEELSLPAGSARSVRGPLRRARRYAVLKERVSSIYTYGYGLYRDYFLELGRRFASKELLSSPEDIFYLNLDELRQIVAGGCAGNTCNNYRLRVAMRKREMAEYQDIDPPSVIYGEVAPPLTPRKLGELRGAPTSGGYYKGKARVVRSPSEFSRVEDGDVLVIPYSDLAWTPLFARAGAVVAEAGGMLSHTSIIAREYGIPAVVSVNGATRMRDGTEVSVDGYSGVVTLSEEEGA